ncbi:hypothetical protein KKH13_03680 [Patescibacteria group bacterium]|nr:hypothetical protein [Patescibacteria group bacterium]
MANNQTPAVTDSLETPSTKKPTGLDWLEKGFGQRQARADDAKKAKEAEADKTQKDQLARLKSLDKKRSQAMYTEIQQQIQLIRKKEEALPSKSVSGASGYNPEQQQKQESLKEKLKRTILPWTSKQSMGTGEVTRGVSG